ncbi:porin family protein [Fulvivirga sp. M361]|uniref:outer membrane protein n=1 Tax=Fulvivirga sp. M361 TaxID=2594266 RepID=UPI00117B9693|nr:outer membrane beta-barrel protein [Fulvivirga sp. M361]TRX62568.1 porin family protein [Fulvivirga sp. M361]
MKIKFLTTTLIISFVAFGGLCAQDITVGGGFAYGTEIENIGLHLDGQYFIKENLAIAPSFYYYFPKEVVPGFDLKWFEFNANVNYYFELDSEVRPYALGGLNFAFLTVPSVSFLGFETEKETSTEVGLNIGAGADFPLGGSVTPFGELRYIIGDADQLAIAAGVRFDIN